jgi:tRNA (cytosine38-C5)-methyltransferase
MDEEFLLHMKSLNLRFFTPREIARIHGIPEWYSFPEALSEKQLYKLLGNGLNVSVVKLLLEKVLLA